MTSTCNEKAHSEHLPALLRRAASALMPPDPTPGAQLDSEADQVRDHALEAQPEGRDDR